MEFEISKESLKKLKREIMKLVAEQIFNESQQNLIRKKWVVATSKGSITTQITDTGALLQSGQVIIGENSAKIIYPLEYAEDIEFGTPPGKKPNFKDILKWVNRKLGIKGKGAEGIAYAICNKIEREGTQPRPFLREAITTVQGKK